MKKVLSLFIIYILFLSGCSSKMQEESFDYFYFDTSINIKFNHRKHDKINVEQVQKDIDGLLKELEQEFSPSIKTSMLSELNTKKSMQVSDDFITVLNKASEFCQQVDGKYDYTSGKLIELWSINNKNYLPTDQEVKNLLAPIDCNTVVVNANNVTIDEKVDLDFGSIVKGFAADKLTSYLTSQGIDSALLNLGGNIQTLGSKPDKSDYRIGIQAPEIENENNSNCAIVNANNQAVVTSGINQRFFVENGKIYHHILDANKGYPVDNDLASVTIITKAGMNADGLSTTAFILGLDQGMDLINSIDGVEAVFITRDKQIYQTSEDLGLEVIDDTYKLVN